MPNRITIKRTPVHFLLILLILAFQSCVVTDRAEEFNGEKDTVMNVIISNNNLTYFSAALVHSGLAYQFNEYTEVTILAPSDEIFKPWIDAFLETEDAEVITDVTPLTLRKEINKFLPMHILPQQRKLTADMNSGDILITSTGLGLRVFKQNQTVQLQKVTGGATTTIIIPDLEGSNGVVHVVNNLLN